MVSGYLTERRLHDARGFLTSRDTARLPRSRTFKASHQMTELLQGRIIPIRVFNDALLDLSPLEDHQRAAALRSVSVIACQSRTVRR